MTKDHLGLRVKKGVWNTRPKPVKRNQLDTRFVSGQVSSINQNVFSVYSHNNGSVYIGGSFTAIDDHSTSKIAKIDPVTGDADPNFTGLRVADVLSIDSQSDGLLIVGGLSSNDFALSKIDPVSGLNIQNFSNIGTSSVVHTVKVLSDDRIMIGGKFTSVDGDTRHINICRLYANGVVDTSFIANVGGSGGRVRSIDVQSDGKILIAGDFTTINGSGVSVGDSIARLHPNGAVDTSFNDSEANRAVYSIKFIENPGVWGGSRILIAGDFTVIADDIGDFSRHGLAMLGQDGNIDTSFNFDHQSITGLFYSAKQLPNGKILAGGQTGIGSGYQELFLIHPNGAIDTTFGTYVFNGTIWDIDVASDGNAYCGMSWNPLVNGKYRAGVLKIKN